jgi:hypothetical protein
LILDEYLKSSALTGLAEGEFEVPLPDASEIGKNLALFEHKRSELLDSLFLLSQQLFTDCLEVVRVSSVKFCELILCDFLVVTTHVFHVLHEFASIIQQPRVVLLRIVLDCEFVGELSVQIQLTKHRFQKALLHVVVCNKFLRAG